MNDCDRVFVLSSACLVAVPCVSICLVSSATRPEFLIKFVAATAFSVPKTLTRAALSLSNGFRASSLALNGCDVSCNVSNETPSASNRSLASFGNASGALSLSITFLKAVPASAPLRPFSANASMSAVDSSTLTFAVLATAPNRNKASVTCGISAAPNKAPFASTLINLPACSAGAPNWFIASVSAVAAAGNSIPDAWLNVMADFVTSFKASAFCNSSGFAEPINL